ncbi:hypothetical protein BJX62DRAFT_243298 [Aspergillus germanicus]
MPPQVSKYCHNKWSDLSRWGPRGWDTCRKQTVVDKRVYVLAFEDEVPYFIDNESYFISRNAIPPDGYILLYDATSRESFAFIERAVGVIVEWIRGGSLVARGGEMNSEKGRDIANNGNRRVDAAGLGSLVRIGSKDKVQHAASSGLLKKLP